MLFRLSVLVLILMVSTASLLSGADKMESSYGIFGHYNYNSHLADFAKLPDIPNCCPQFKGGSGNGFSVGLLYNLKMNSWMSAQVRARYSILSADLTSTESIELLVAGEKTDGEFQYILETDLALGSLSPMISFYPIPDLRLNVGADIGFLLTKTYYQREEITKPTNVGTFIGPDGEDTESRIRNEFEGDIPQASALQLGLLAGAGYDLPLNSSKSLVLTPEVFFYYGISPIIPDYSWNITAIHAGISLSWNPDAKQDIIIREEVVEPKKPDTTLAQAEPEDELQKSPENTKLATYRLTGNIEKPVNSTNNSLPKVIISESSSEYKSVAREVLDNLENKYNVVELQPGREFEVSSNANDMLFEKFNIMINGEDTLIVVNSDEDGKYNVILPKGREFTITAANQDELYEAYKVFVAMDDDISELVRMIDPDYQVSPTYVLSGNVYKADSKQLLDEAEISLKESGTKKKANPFSKQIVTDNEKYSIETIVEDSLYMVTPKSGMLTEPFYLRVDNEDTVFVTYSKADGSYEFELAKGREFLISAQASELFFDSYKLEIDKKDTITRVTKEFFIPEQLTLRINFPYDNFDEPYEFILDSNGVQTNKTWQEELDLLGRNLILSQDFLSTVNLVGHTDDVGSDQYNNILGQTRVDFIIKQLAARGVDANILEGASAGKKELLPKRPGENAEDFRKRLRRVELEKVLK